MEKVNSWDLFRVQCLLGLYYGKVRKFRILLREWLLEWIMDFYSGWDKNVDEKVDRQGESGCFKERDL